MRKEGNLLFGTIDEIVQEATKNCFIDGRLAAKTEFHQFDFTVEYEDRADSLETIKNNAAGWYGIIRITEFDSENLDLFGDYYGGECGVYHRIFSGTPEKECRKELENMLLEILSVEYGNLSSKDILLAEFNRKPLR